MVKYNNATAGVFSALSDETRFDIMQRLMKHEELPAGAIATPYQMSLPAVSKHLRVLEDAKLVRVKKSGQQRLYTPERKTLSEFRSFLENSSLFWEGAIDRMISHVENNN